MRQLTGRGLRIVERGEDNARLSSGGDVLVHTDRIREGEFMGEGGEETDGKNPRG